MDISLIGANAGSVWNALHENGELSYQVEERNQIV